MYLKEMEYILAIERYRTIYRAAEELGIKNSHNTCIWCYGRTFGC